MKRKLQNFILCIAFSICMVSVVHARGIYQEPDEFLSEVFNGDIPEVEMIWLKNELKARSKQILGHKPRLLRVRYWGRESKTAWILEEIGKEKPITTGIVISGNNIEQVKVLIFRESRGWEVRYPFFTDQFKKVRLLNDDRLDKHIDGISGATLSVNAITRLARFALLLHGYTAYSQNSTHN